MRQADERRFPDQLAVIIVVVVLLILVIAVILLAVLLALGGLWSHNKWSIRTSYNGRERG